MAIQWNGALLTSIKKRKQSDQKIQTDNREIKFEIQPNRGHKKIFPCTNLEKKNGNRCFSVSSRMHMILNRRKDIKQLPTAPVEHNE